VISDNSDIYAVQGFMPRKSENIEGIRIICNHSVMSLCYIRLLCYVRLLIFFLQHYSLRIDLFKFAAYNFYLEFQFSLQQSDAVFSNF